MGAVTDFKVSKTSIISKVLDANNQGFKELVANENLADFYGKVDLTIAHKIEAGRDVKSVVDLEIKKLKKAQAKLRELTIDFMANENIEKVEGTKIKSITFQEPKKVKKTITDKQIKKGRSYVSLSTLSKDDLVQMLEEKGVKTKIVTTEIEEDKDANIRVVR